MACPLRRVHLDLFFSCIGLLVGFVGFGLLTFYYFNYEAGLLGFSSGILASLCFHIHRLYRADILRNWYSIDTFRNIQVLAVIGMGIGAGFIGWNVFLIYHRPENQAFYMSEEMNIIWGGLDMIYGAHLFDTLRRYSRMPNQYQSVGNLNA